MEVDTGAFKALTNERMATLDRLEALLGSTNILLSAAYEQGWNECLAYVLRGDLRHRRPRPVRAGPRPDLRSVEDGGQP